MQLLKSSINDDRNCRNCETNLTLNNECFNQNCLQFKLTLNDLVRKICHFKLFFTKDEAV